MVPVDAEEGWRQSFQCFFELSVAGIAIVVGTYIAKDHNNVNIGQLKPIAEGGHLGCRAVYIAGVVDHDLSPHLSVLC
jgi:hypothetical protein